ncbi:MAG TPA: dihydroneopterin aldolase [Candidatus Hydrogenedentes bacterium]|nr:dihydroneopterin aldolase [Candidatus Hydrogenedentota bacterium]HNT89600.1 dihydroneopterin aldolase [Candidatus Hydrogenedentota bacterium]
MTDRCRRGASTKGSAGEDRIHIRDLLTRCIVGIYPEERREKQDIVINITLYADLSRAGQTDRIEDTVDYKAVKKQVLALVEKSSFLLIERLAEAIAEICLAAPGVVRAAITVDKPGALRFARSVAVEIVRDRPDGS